MGAEAEFDRDTGRLKVKPRGDQQKGATKVSPAMSSARQSAGDAVAAPDGIMMLKSMSEEEKLRSNPQETGGRAKQGEEGDTAQHG